MTQHTTGRWADGYELPAGGQVSPAGGLAIPAWGPEIPAGGSGIAVTALHSRSVGYAEAVVVITRDQTVELEYCYPLWSFMAGSLGRPPQHHRGALSVVVFVAVMTLLLCATLALFAELND